MEISFTTVGFENGQSLNPILTGGGGGGQFDPPLHEICDCVATAADRDTLFHDFFLSSLTHLLIPSLRKSDHRSRGHNFLYLEINQDQIAKNKKIIKTIKYIRNKNNKIHKKFTKQ